MIVNSENSQKKLQILNYESYLEQESGFIFKTWKKFYYVCLEGVVLIYTENKESKIVLGHIPILNMSLPESSESKVFNFTSEEKVYKLKAESPEAKEKWMNFLAKIIKDKEVHEKEFKERFQSVVSRDTVFGKKNNEVADNQDKKIVIDEKISSINKKIARIIKKHGYILNKEDSLSEEMLDNKGITKLMNVKDPKIKNRIHHGFLYKKHKAHDYFQKRWLFIFSSRPLFDKEYIQDDSDLEAKRQKEWIKFDTLYYFKVEDKEPLGELNMGNSHKIINFEIDQKYYLNLDVGERIYDFYCDNKFDRDEWFEVLKNSRRTAKEYLASKTQKPRNIELLNAYFQKGEKEFTKKMENEKKNLVGNYEEIMEYEVFEYNQNNLRDLILSTIDGCLSNVPIKKELLKTYTEYMLREYLEITRSFWDRLYNKIEHSVILKMSMLLLNFRENLLDLYVDDQNLYKNGKELVKIYFKKTYQNILSVIQSILKNEREIKKIESETGEYVTHGPSDLFEILSRTFDLVKENKDKCVYKELLLLFKESIKQYLIGVDTVLMNLDIILDDNYLIAVANNSFSMVKLLNNLMDDMKEMNVLTEQEINEGIQNQKLMYTINKVSQNAISNFVSTFRIELGKEFKNINYIDIKMENILVKTNDVFFFFKSKMNALVIKKCYNEILKLTLYLYISSLLTTATKTQKTVEDLREKIKYDEGILRETYESLVGPNLTKSTLKIMNDIHDFLDVSSYMISSSCLTLRQYIGKSFTISTAKAIIKLRSDFSSEEKDDAIEQCKEVLEKYNEPDNNDNGGYFQYIEKELKKQEKEEKRQQELLSKMSQSQNENTSRHSILYSQTFVNFAKDNKEDESDSEDEEKELESKQTIVGMDISEFFADEADEEEEEKKKEEELNIIDIDIKESIEYKEVSDIEHEGFMSKKSHSKWQKRFFQLKTGYLYWFLDKKSSIIQNKISIKDTIKVESHKDKKFLIRVKEKEEENVKDKKKEIKVKEYKFMCESEEEKVQWILAITNSMKKMKNSKILKKEGKLDIKPRKKIIHDLFKLPEINKDTIYMRKKVLEEMKDEHFFSPSQRKIEADKKRKEKEEEERKRKEKEEIERKKREEKERKRKEEEEKDRQIEKDIKEGKDVGVKNRIKFWFKGFGKGNEEEEQKEENKNDNKDNDNKDDDDNKEINNFNLDDFMNGDSEDDKEKKENENDKNIIDDNSNKNKEVNDEIKTTTFDNNKNETKIDTQKTKINEDKVETKDEIKKDEDKDKDNIINNKESKDNKEEKTEDENKEKNDKAEEELNININKEEKKEEESDDEQKKENDNSNSNLNNAFCDEDLYSDRTESSEIDKEDEKKKEKDRSKSVKEKKKVGCFGSIFSCGSKNEDRNERRKNKMKKKKDQKLIKEEIKQMKKEQIDIKTQKREIEKEIKKDKIKQNHLKDKKFTIIEEEKSVEEEEEDDNKKKEEEKELEKEKLRILESEVEEEEKDKNEIKEEEKKEIEKKEKENENNDDINKEEEKKEMENESNEDTINKEEDIKKEEENIIKENVEKEEKKKKKEKVRNKKKKKKKKEKLEKIEEEKISEKSNESSNEKEKEKEKEEVDNIKDNNLSEEEKDKIFNDKDDLVYKKEEKVKKKKNSYMKNSDNFNNSEEEVESGNEKKEKDKKSFNRYSDNDTYNYSNKDYNDVDTDSNNIVNFLGSYKDNNSKKENLDEDDDEKEFLKKIKTNKISENIEIIPEKKEEDDETEEQKKDNINYININNKSNMLRTSTIQFIEAKHLLENSNISNRNNEFNGSTLPRKLIRKTKKAERIMKDMENNYRKNMIEEKIAKFKDEIPDIKTKYEIHLEEDLKRNDNNDEAENKKNEENNDKVKDWWGDIF